MSKKIILTGGGSAGHVTPNIALLPGLRERGFEIHYVGQADGIEHRLIAEQGDVIFHSIEAGKLRRYFSLKNLTDPFKVLKGISGIFEGRICERTRSYGGKRQMPGALP